MTKKVSLSGREKSCKSIQNWYEDHSAAIADLRVKVTSSILGLTNGIIVNEKFQSLDLIEANRYFDDSREELERLVCFDLISATEALLRVDYYQRIKQREKSPIGRTFRSLNKKKGNKISLEEDIIETWKNNTNNKIFGDFLGLLKYRHWLAHGRYWTPKIGREYSFDIAYEISENILNFIANQN